MASKNPSVKRIQREIAEIQLDNSDLYAANPLEDNLFEWHFTIAGPNDTEFEGGLYHGQILLPPEYPFKPPWVVFKTPNGRFQLNQKICLSVTAYHPEEWNPSWGIRTVLLGVISHFPVQDKSSIGYLDYSTEERAKLARESVDYVCPTCKVSNRCLLRRPQRETTQPSPTPLTVDAETKKPVQPMENAGIFKNRVLLFLLLAALAVGILVAFNKQLFD